MIFNKLQPRQIVLCILMLIIGFFFVKQYAGFIEIPTKSMLIKKNLQLKSLQNDLEVAQANALKRQEKMADLQKYAKPYWINDSNSRMMIDQTINKEFSQIVRKAQLPSPPKISISRNKIAGVNYLQLVQIHLEHRNISMKEISRLFIETEKYGKKLIWNYCRIEPDNPSNPNNVNFSAKINTLVLNPDPAEFLNSGQLKNPTAEDKKK